MHVCARVCSHLDHRHGKKFNTLETGIYARYFHTLLPSIHLNSRAWDEADGAYVVLAAAHSQAAAGIERDRCEERTCPTLSVSISE